MFRRSQRSGGARRPRLAASEITPEVFANEGFNEKRAEAKTNEVRNGAAIMEQSVAFPESRPCRDAAWGIMFSILSVAMLGFALYYIFVFATEPATMTFAIPEQDSDAYAYNESDTTPLNFAIESSTPVTTSVEPVSAALATSSPGTLALTPQKGGKEGLEQEGPGGGSVTQRLLQEVEEDEEEIEQDSGTMVGLLLTASIVGGVLGLLAGYPFILLAHQYTNTVVHIALLLGPALLIFSGVSMLLAAVAGGVFGAVLLILGVLSIAMGIFMLFLILCCWGKLIPFTVRVVHMVAGVAKKFPTLMVAPVIGGLLGSLWVLVCFVVFAGTGLKHQESIQHADRNQRYVGVFTVFLVVYWGAEVARGLAHVTICGVYGQWYFGLDRDKSKSEVVMSSLKVACVTSYGSICLGTFLVAVIQALEMVARQMMEDARRDGNGVMQCVACIIACALSCIGDIMEYFNEWAYVQCAIRGLGFFDAAKVTYALCTLANVTYILDDLLVNYVVLLGSLLCAGIGAIAGALLGLAWAGAPGLGAGMLIGFLSAFTSGSAAMSVFSSGTKTILSCWAESPETLRLKDGAEAPGAAALAHDFEHGPRQEDDDTYPEGV